MEDGLITKRVNFEFSNRIFTENSQHPKISFNFLAASPPFRFSNGKEIFGFAAREGRALPEARRHCTPQCRTWKYQSHHALRALQIVSSKLRLEVSSSCVVYDTIIKRSVFEPTLAWAARSAHSESPAEPHSKAGATTAQQEVEGSTRWRFYSVSTWLLCPLKILLVVHCTLLKSVISNVSRSGYFGFLALRWDFNTKIATSAFKFL